MKIDLKIEVKVNVAQIIYAVTGLMTLVGTFYGYL